LSKFSNYLNRAKYSGMPLPPKLTWIREADIHGPACSQCAWLFRPAGAPTGTSLQQMKEDYMRCCNEEFAAHVCAEHPRAAKTEMSVIQFRRSRNIEGHTALAVREVSKVRAQK
jgi:hypothetical protein